jgi:ParB-like chromosome segregation protein Spo0J
VDSTTAGSERRDSISGGAALRALRSAVEGERVELSISALLPADSPRLEGVSEQHTQVLAESEGELPPIIVHRSTMRVIDGMHRLNVAERRGQATIQVRLFDGTDAEAFVAAVDANIRHGLPLSLADRQAAAARILASEPLWSDRAIASVSGMATKNVRAIRQSMIAETEQVNARIGRDGRIRPVDGTAGRARASELFRARPEASLREVARVAGISPATARDVRARMRRGEDPVELRRGAAPAGAQGREPVTVERRLRLGLSKARVSSLCGRDGSLRHLRRDPAIRFSENGRLLLRWLDTHAVGADGWGEIADSVPPHCGYVIADLACAIADEWLQIAEAVRRNADTAEPSAGEPEPLNGPAGPALGFDRRLQADR